MKPAKFMLLCLILLNAMLLNGCWNYNDIEKRSLVSGFAIDKNEQGDKYILTIEVLDFEMSGKDAKQTSKHIESEGGTIFDAVRNAIISTGKRLYWAHSRIVIISKEIAEEGITPALDLIYRDSEMREEMYILVSKEKTAKEILKQEVLLSQPSATNIENMLIGQEFIGKAFPVKIYQLVADLEEKGISVTLPAIELKENSGKRTAVSSGTAIFKSDKLVGFIDPDETKCLLFVLNKFKKGSINLNQDSQNKMDNISLEVFNSKTKVSPEYIDKKLSMKIDIRTEVAIAEIATNVDYINEKNRYKIKNNADKILKTSVERLIKKIQKDFDSDIFGFGRLLKANMPSMWSGTEDKWDKVFKELDIAVTVDINLKNSALVSKTLKKGD